MQTAQKNEKDRRVVHCLLCHKPQDGLPTHLARVCMKMFSSEERLAELQRAKDSTKAWSRQGRNWEYVELCKIVPDRASRLALVQHLQKRDFFVAGAPREEDMQKDLTSDSEDSSPDPTESSLPINREVRCNMQKMGLYEKFPSHTPILLEFKEYLVKQRGSLHQEVSLFLMCSDETTERKGPKRARDLSDDDSGGRKDFGQFLEAFPVTLTGRPPSKRKRAEAGFAEGRRFYDKWRGVQCGRREEYLLSKIDHPPNVATVTEMIDREGWTANHPHPGDIVAKWSPPKSIETDEDIMRRMLEQQWSGVAVKDYGDNGEQGVVATRSFTKGSVICDYPGELITAEEGLRILESAADDMGYLFFFSSDSRRLCINVRTQPGQCDPSLEAVGIKTNHTRKNPNVKPLPVRMKFSHGEKDSLLLVAARDITVDEELLLGIET